MKNLIIIFSIIIPLAVFGNTKEEKRESLIQNLDRTMEYCNLMLNEHDVDNLYQNPSFKSSCEFAGYPVTYASARQMSAQARENDAMFSEGYINNALKISFALNNFNLFELLLKIRGNLSDIKAYCAKAAPLSGTNFYGQDMPRIQYLIKETKKLIEECKFQLNKI